jgi:peptidyl-Lys metalloendopeptidase
MIKCELIVQDSYQGDAIDVTIRLKNTSDKPIKILTWGTPLEGLQSNFLVIRKGHASYNPKVPYIGILAKRGNPTEENFIIIPVDGSKEVTIDILEGYDISSFGDYRIKAEFYITFDKNGVLDIMKCSTAYNKINFQHAKKNLSAFFWDDFQQKKEELYTHTIKFDLNIIEFEDREITSVGKKENLKALTASLQRCIKKVIQHLQLFSTPEYIKWFGTFSEKKWSRVFFVCVDIYHLLTNFQISIKEYGFNCNDHTNNPKIAYVFPKEQTIYICEKFWELPECGRESKLGVLYHELSHLAGNTDDINAAFNESLCRRLATLRPVDAVENANNYQYFIEDICCDTSE